MKFSINLHIFLLSFLGVQLLHAQDVFFERITTEQGLSNNMVARAIQDKQGFLWFATNNGLNRYNGYHFRIFRTSDADTNTISNDNVTAIYEDTQGYIWLGTQEGLNRLDPATMTFTRFFHDPSDPASLSDDEILSLCEDPRGYLWIGTNGGGLNRLDLENFDIERFHTGYDRIPSITEDERGILWIGTNDGTILECNSKSEMVRFTSHRIQLPASNDLMNNDVWFIRNDFKNRLIVGMTSGIYYYDIRKENFAPFISNLDVPGSFRNNEIRCLQQNGDKKYWIGTWGKGIYRYDPKSNDIDNYRIEPNNPNSLSNNDVNFILTDRSGVTWIGTQDGINKIDPGTKLFRHFQSIPDDHNSLSLNYVTAFEEDKNHNLWIGTFGGGINRFDPDRGIFRPYQHDASNSNSLINDAVRVVRMDHDGFLWIGTMNGIDRFDPRSQRFEHFRHQKDRNSLSGNDIMAIIEDSQHTLWIGTYGDGLCSLDPERKHFTSYTGQKGDSGSISGKHVRAIFEDSKSYLWIGLVESEGLYRYDPVTGKFAHYLHDPKDSLSLSNSNVNSIYEDQQGRIWVGTWDGLNLYNPGSDNFTSLKRKDGLPDAKVVEMLSDNNNNLWISSQMGLSKLRYTDSLENVINYSLINGIQGNEFNINAKLKSHSGIFYFGGTNGFNSFKPDEVTINDYVPPVVITDFQVFNTTIIPGKLYEGKQILSRSVNTNPEIHLRYSDRVISFEFSALSYSVPNKNQFAYKLSGIDKGWVITNAGRRFATYTNLEAGEYTFHVKASNCDGIWNQEGTSLRITVAPPPWKTWWAYLVYSVVIVLIVLGIRRIALVRLKLKNDVLMEQMEKEKIEHINQMKLSFFTNISHEFKTPLTLILGPLEEMISRTKLDSGIKKQLVLMHRNANRLLRLINQLMDFRKLDRGGTRLTVSHGDIIGYIGEIKKAFDEHSEKQNITYTLKTSGSAFDGWFDPDKLEKIVYNLISNAFKFTPPGGRIMVTVSLESLNCMNNEQLRNESRFILESKGISPGNEDVMEICISDSGIGIPEDRLPYIFDRFYQIRNSEHLKNNLEVEGTGIGLALTRSLVQACRGEISVSSSPGQGTEFTVRLPVNRHLFSSENIKDEVVNVEKMHYEPSLYLMDEDNTPPSPNDPLSEETEVSEKTPLVLVVEDNPELRTFLRYTYEPAYRILEASDGEQGLKIARDTMPDLIISDVMMPGMNGFDLCKRLKSDLKTAHIPVILLTAKNNIESTIEGYSLGADDYIPKPFNPKLMAVRMRNLIESRQKMREDLKKELILQPSEKKLRSADDVFLEKAVAVIEENISNSEFNVDDFGNALNMSRMQLYRKLKSLTSLSANEFIRTIRLKRSAQLLEKGGLTVSEVTYEVGFSDPKYFSKCFQKAYGKTPSKYAAMKK